MSERTKTWTWRAAKWLLTIAILVGVGRQFYRDLSAPTDPSQPDIRQIDLRPPWLVASGSLYLLALSMSACFWYRLLLAFNNRPPFLKAYRAYFIGQLGKYVPGKAWSLFMRGSMVAGPGVNMGVAIMTSFYEVLTTMAAGALVAAIVFLFDPPQIGDLQWSPLFTVLLLLGVCGLPLLPGVFNRLTQRLARKINMAEPLGALRINTRLLVEGLLITSCGWTALGLSMWCLLAGVLAEPPPLTILTLARLCGSIGLGYVAGFLAFVIPSGVGVREYFLLNLLRFAGPEKGIAASVLLLRLVWTSAEVVMTTVVFFLKGRNDERKTENGERRTEANV